ncbi:MAG: hypothetical protein Kow0056_12860 [Coriobacteriia bacterium]
MSDGIGDFLTALTAARKAVQLYPESHPTFREAMDRLLHLAGTELATGPLALNMHEGRLHKGSEVIPADSSAVEAIAAAMESRRIESIVIEPGFDESDAVSLAQVLNLRPSPDFDAQAELEARGVSHVRASALVDEEAEARAERDRQRAEDRAAYNRIVTTLKRLMSQATEGQAMELAAASPMVESVLSRLLEDEAAILGLATMTSGSEAELMHAVSVMIYSLNLGVAMGIPEEGLVVLGLSALTHDIGKAPFDTSDPQQAEARQALHPTVGAELLSRVSDDAGTTAMLVAYEHHMAHDGTGYPDRESGYVTHPYSRIVAIADKYDRLLRHGAGGEPMTPDRSVMALLSAAGKSLDPFFTRLFVRSIGVFPIGCVVRLDDHSVGIVRGKGEDPLKPLLRLVFGPDGLPLDPPSDVELADDGREIVEVVDPDALGIEVADYL